jgi:ferredoxin
MKATVDSGTCIGCEWCVSIASDDFKMNDEGIAEASNDEIKNEDEVTEAIESCPVDAISKE